MRTDYLIIGAGLSGCTCAYLLKRAGADVVLVERGDLVRRSKLCAGLVTPRAQDELSRIYGLAVEGVYRQSLSDMRAVAGEREVLVRGPLTKSVRREELDRFALGAYREADGVVVDNVQLHGLDLARGIALGRHCGSGEPVEFRFGHLVAADGALSWTRRQVTGATAPAVLALEAEVKSNGAPYTMACRSGFHGYSWYAPAGETAKVGCVSYEPGRFDIASELRSFAGWVGVDLGRWRGAFIPTGDDVLLRADAVSFLGDAAGLICPPSGEGIFHAVHSARMLARAERVGASYPALMRPHVAQIARQRALRDLFFDPRFMRVGLSAASRTPYGPERAVKFALKHFASFE